MAKKSSNFLTKEVGTTVFIDSKQRKLTVRHKVVLSDLSSRELKERIAEDLFRVQAVKNRLVSGRASGNA